MLRRSSSTSSTSLAVLTWSLSVPDRAQQWRPAVGAGCRYGDGERSWLHGSGPGGDAPFSQARPRAPGRDFIDCRAPWQSAGRLRGVESLSVGVSRWPSRSGAHSGHPIARDRSPAGLCRHSHDETGSPVTGGGQAAIRRFSCKGSQTESFERFRNGKSMRTSRGGMRWSLSSSSSCREPDGETGAPNKEPVGRVGRGSPTAPSMITNANEWSVNPGRKQPLDFTRGAPSLSRTSASHPDGGHAGHD